MHDLRIRYPQPGRVELASRTLFADPGNPFCRRFIGRLFSVREVESLTIGRAGAEIRYAPGRTTLPEIVRRIAGALAKTGGRDVVTKPLYLSPLPGVPVRVRRYGHVLSTWEIRHSLPGRFRLRHPALRPGRHGVADALVEELSAVPGVLACRTGRYTRSLLVLHDPRRLGRDELLRLCESALHKVEAREVDDSGLVGFGVGGALLGLAVAGHLTYPPLLAVSAALLVAANVGTFRRAWKAFRAGSVDTDVIYSALLALTVLSGDFLAIAVMAWSVAVWPLLLERRLSTTRQALGGVHRRLAQAEPDAMATETLRRLLESAGLQPVSAPLGGRALPPPLAPSARRAMRTGLGMTTFALAPNYADPGLGTPLDRSATLLACADAGFLVRGEPALVRLAEVDAVAIDAAGDEPGIAALVNGLRARGIEQILLAPSSDTTDTARHLRRLRRAGFKVALIGHGDDLAAAREADVAIALGGPHLPPVEVADIVLVSPRAVEALDLLDLARIHAREARLSRHLGLWPTLLAAGGAFMLGLPTLHCVLLTNVGALTVYWRGSKRLGDAEADWRARQP